jgi:hypothetical protein
MPIPAASASCGLRIAPVGEVIAVEDAHEGGLAGAVLADDAVDGAGANDERDVPVGVNLAEPLVDAAELDDRHGLRGIARARHRPGW